MLRPRKIFRHEKEASALTYDQYRTPLKSQRHIPFSLFLDFLSYFSLFFFSSFGRIELFRSAERTVRIRKVVGSIPIRSTILRKITANSAVIFRLTAIILPTGISLLSQSTKNICNLHSITSASVSLCHKV